ncbi:MAG: universal stress protein [Desulfobacterales bacterium]|nr:universal stress protein [Desulfobacterales bacterium]
MVPEIKKILFTTNLSPNMRTAFDYAVSLADRYSGVITVLHVMEEVSPSSDVHIKTFLGEEQWQELQKSHEQEAKQILIGKRREGAMIKAALEEFCAAAQKDHDECEIMTDETIVTRGNVVDEILRVSTDKQCDLIVMGYHDRGKFGEAVLGSTTRRVLRRSQIPVMLVRIPEAE